MRDNFSEKTKKALASRVGYRCSNPQCLKLTIGPNKEQYKFSSIGVAAHITAASIGGPRYDISLSRDERKNINNGIWLCENCAKLIDSDEKEYSVQLLLNWKFYAESLAKKEISSNKNITKKKYIYKDVQYNSKLELTWGIFFDLERWEYTYLPYEHERWKPSFKINLPIGQIFYVDIGLKNDFNIEKRLSIGAATQFSKEILCLFEDPFNEDYLGNRNHIGLCSVGRNMLNDKIDFEFCSSLVINLFDGVSIVNMCEDNFDPNDIIHTKHNQNIHFNYWKEAKNIANNLF
jgi:hypothetical protein